MLICADPCERAHRVPRPHSGCRRHTGARRRMDGGPIFCWDLDPATLAGVLFHQAADALLVVHPISERVLEANAMAEQLSEFSRAELVRFSLRSLVRHEQEW